MAHASRHGARHLRKVMDVTEQLEDQDQRLASRRVADALREKIMTGELAVGTYLPTFADLATTYEVAKNTAIAAVRILREEGLVNHRPNARASVRNRQETIDTSEELRRLRVELADLQTQVRQAGVTLASVEGRISEVVSRLSALGT